MIQALLLRAKPKGGDYRLGADKVADWPDPWAQGSGSEVDLRYCPIFPESPYGTGPCKAIGSGTQETRVPQQDMRELADRMRPNAAAFIVTIYGDIVVPRAGVLWTGSLIALCERVGINESLVRTAISRLVAARQLAGERIGRRSYYRLESQASTSFMAAADLLYGPDRPAKGWQILYDKELKPEDARRQRLGHMGGQVFIRPDRGQPFPDGALGFRAEAVATAVPLAEFWDLTVLSEGYAGFMQLFSGLDPAALGDADALTARLLLVHAYRFVLLRDPRLPAEHLPPNWNAAESRALFRRTYGALTPAAHRHIAACCEGVDGLLPAETESTAQRRAGLLRQS